MSSGSSEVFSMVNTKFALGSFLTSKTVVSKDFVSNE